MALIAKRTREGNSEARRLLERSLSLSPNFAPAHAAIAWSQAEDLFFRYAEQDTKDILVMPAVSGNDAQTAELAKLKGGMIAFEQASVRKLCRHATSLFLEGGASASPESAGRIACQSGQASIIAAPASGAQISGRLRAPPQVGQAGARLGLSATDACIRVVMADDGRIMRLIAALGELNRHARNAEALSCS
jgi:hypothetical protein